MTGLIHQALRHLSTNHTASPTAILLEYTAACVHGNNSMQCILALRLIDRSCHACNRIYNTLTFPFKRHVVSERGTCTSPRFRHGTGPKAYGGPHLQNKNPARQNNRPKVEVSQACSQFAAWNPCCIKDVAPWQKHASLRDMVAGLGSKSWSAQGLPDRLQASECWWRVWQKLDAPATNVHGQCLNLAEFCKAQALGKDH